MNSRIYHKRFRSFSLQTIARNLPLIILPAILGGVATGWLIGGESEAVVARQAMALRNVDWSDLASTHEANVAWLERNRDALLGGVDAKVEVLPPENRQLSLFSIESEAADETGAVTALTLVTAAMALDIDPFGDRDAEAERLQTELDSATARVVEFEADIEELRLQRAEAVSRDASNEVSEIDRESVLAEVRLQQWDQRSNQLELRIAELDGRAKSSNQAIGDPEVRPPTVATSGRIAGALATFVIGLGLVFAILTYARVRGRIRSGAHLGLLAPGIPVVSMNEQDAAPSVAFLAKLITTQTRKGMVAIVDVSEKDGGRRVASLLHSTLTRMSVTVYYPETNADFDEVERRIHRLNHDLPIVLSPRYTGQALAATVALCTHVILVSTSGLSRAKEFRRVLDIATRLQVKPLASVLNAPSLRYGDFVSDPELDDGWADDGVGDLSFNPRQTYDLSDLLR